MQDAIATGAYCVHCFQGCKLTCALCSPSTEADLSAAIGEGRAKASALNARTLLAVVHTA
eukprot:19982-Heterococcus_DN1.PRE.1